MSANYDYKTIRVSKETAAMCEKVMSKMGCKTLNTFTTMALIDYCKKVSAQLGIKE